MFEEPKDPDDAELRAQFEALMAGGAGLPKERKAHLEEESDDPSAALEGVVSGIAGTDVFVEWGIRRQGVLPLGEFDEPPAVGDRVQFQVVDDRGDLWTLSRKDARRAETWRSLDVGKWVKAQFVAVNKGGLTAKVGPLDAFVPISQIDLIRVEDPSEYVGRSEICEVMEAAIEKKRIVLSRRKVLEAEREEARKKAVAELVEGSVRRGRVTRVETYGAFVELAAGLEGLVHVSNLGHRRVRHAREVVDVGQEIEVVVLGIEEGGRRIALGTKQIGPQPWEDAELRYSPGRVVEGVVTRLLDFGAFVELEPGVEGLLHVSELSAERVKRPSDVVQEGQRIRVRVLSVDGEEKKISLSRKGSDGRGLADDAAVDEDEPVPPPAADGPRGTNLGDVLRKALDPKDGRSPGR